MGCSLSPPVVQKCVTQFFRGYDQAWPFLDDVTIASTDVESHLEEDLPKMLALCSFYNFLLKPSKADMLRPSVQILGHQIGEGSMTLALEKVM